MLQNQGSNLLALTLVYSLQFDEWILIPKSLQWRHDSLNNIEKVRFNIRSRVKDKNVVISPNIPTTVLKIESRTSLVAACALPVGAITGETGLTAERVSARDIPFWCFCLGNWKLCNCSFIKWRPVVAFRSPWPMPDLEELTSSAWALILDVIISWIAGRNLWLLQNKMNKIYIIRYTL